MSRTHHLTRGEMRPTRARAKTRLTNPLKTGGQTYFSDETNRPRNAGNHWMAGNNRGQRSRKEQRLDKIFGKRRERRRLNSGLP